MADANSAVLVLAIGTVVLFALLIGCVYVATRSQHKKN
jgi:cbb3-type cytochrome oxidase subunit 3